MSIPAYKEASLPIYKNIPAQNDFKCHVVYTIWMNQCHINKLGVEQGGKFTNYTCAWPWFKQLILTGGIHKQ